jgi:FkbM family methyltransferase
VPDAFPLPGQQILIPASKTHVEINVGAHLSPIPRSDPNVFLILVEPNPEVARSIKNESNCDHYRLWPGKPCETKGDVVFQVAISNFTGNAQFNLYGNSAGSSSLSKASHAANWNEKHETIDVQVHTLKELLDSVPASLPITFLKTDMQGHDLAAIKSAGPSIARAEKIMAEVFGPRMATYEGVVNDYASWAEYMQEMGYDAGVDPRNGKPCKSLMDARDYAEQDCVFDKVGVRASPLKKALALLQPEED